MSIRTKIAKWLAPELVRERDNWEDTAKHYADGQEYYRGLIIKIGEMYGVGAMISDDGSVQDSVIAPKVPQLVAKTKELYADLEGANAALWLKLEWAKCALRNIIALKTPKCAHAARRMADIAEAALSHSELTKEKAQ